nr:D-ribitol-5-phosphate cytidylyltransferase-like isoform X3 [Pocillopora verrucosa]
MAAVVDAKEPVCYDVVAVLPAGGSGVRMNLRLPKQFCEIKERPLISYTLAAFESVSWIREVVVPINVNFIEEAQQILKDFNHSKVRLVYGGSTRHRSLWNGIQAITADGRGSPTVVILHDAVRPFVDEQTLRNVTMAAKKHGAAGMIRPLSSTVVAQLCDGFLDHSLDRSKFRASEMPQAFKYEVIQKAYMKCTEYDFDYGTECLHLAQKYADTNALLIDGPEFLWKVTHRKDLYSAEGVLKEKQQQVLLVINGTDFPEFAGKLHEQLQERDEMVTYLPDISSDGHLSQDTAQCLASQINLKQIAPGCCVSVVYVTQSTHSDEQAVCKGHNTTVIQSFLRSFCETLDSCLLKSVKLVNVGFRRGIEDFNTFKAAIKDLQSCLQQQGVNCFGVLVPANSANEPEDKDADIKRIVKAAELTVGALLDVPSLFGGQVFDANA